MTINVTGRGTTVQDSFRETLEDKLSKFDRFFNDDARANVTVTNEGGRETVEVTIQSAGMVFRSEHTSRDRFESLDMVVDRLFTQIVKNKSKLETKLRRNAFDPGYERTEEDKKEEKHKIVRSKEFALKPMDPEEAVLQMDMLGHNFFMFLNANTDEVCVVYKRNDGNYGLIEPRPEY